MKPGTRLQWLAKFSLAMIWSWWMLAAFWFAFVEQSPLERLYPAQPHKIEAAHNEKLAQCRRLPTSDARYQCTSKVMLAKDNALFDKVIVLLMPVLALPLGYFGLRRILSTSPEQAKRHAAREFSRQRMAAWRANLDSMKAELAMNQTTAPARRGPPAVRPINGIRPPRAKTPQTRQPAQRPV